MQKGPASPSGETGPPEQTCIRINVPWWLAVRPHNICDTMNYLALACEDYEDLL